MSIRGLLPRIFAILAFSTMFITLANSQMNEQAARDRALSTVRSLLHLSPDQFLAIHRDEDLEQSLAIAAIGWQNSSWFIYTVSQTGVEVKPNTIIHHVATDADLIYIVAINSRDETTYCIHGFGLTKSLGEFERLMATLKVQVTSRDQAESIADFYRKVNPENRESLTPILSLTELKQAAQRQCQTNSFETSEEAFNAWWQQGKLLYANVLFRETTIANDNGYLVEWIVLSSPDSGGCGGAPLQAQLDVNSDGHIGKITFSPLDRDQTAAFQTIKSLCSLQQKATESSHETVRVSGIYGPGLDHTVLADATCPGEPTWVELALRSQKNKEKLRMLLDRSRRAYVVVEGEFYGPPGPDPKLPEVIRKSYLPGWGHLAAFKTKLVVHTIREVKVARTDHMKTEATDTIEMAEGNRRVTARAKPSH